MVDDAMRFESLHISDWRQFARVNVDFHGQLTVLTGANASGKTTLLTLLARHFNWHRQYIGVPYSSRSRGALSWRWLRRRRTQPEAGWEDVGRISYGMGRDTAIQVPPEQGQQVYELQLPGQLPVPGLYLPSHRSMSGGYVGIASIPTAFAGPDALLEQFSSEVRQRAAGGTWQKTPLAWLKEALISAAVFGEGNSSVDPNDDARNVWLGFQEILRQLLPPSLGFRRLRVRTPEVVLETDSGLFVLDESSGGMNALMEVAWQIFLRSRAQPSFTVVWDEPENHLHPSLQRDILPNLTRAFPLVQFIVATHSPFVVTAEAESSVYVLDYGDDNRVHSRLLDRVNKAANADEILRRVLGRDGPRPASER